MEPTQLDQLLLERRSIQDGKGRYRRLKRLRPAETPPAFQFLQKHLDPLKKAIERDKEKLGNVGAGRPSLRKEVFLALPDESLALITVGTALTAVLTRGSEATVTSIARQIAELCRREIQFMSRPKTARQRTTPHWIRRKVVGWRSRYLSADHLIEDEHVIEEVNIGATLIGLLLASTTGFTKDYRPARWTSERHERARILKLTAESEAWFKRAHEKVEGLMPVNLPMVVVPDKWRRSTAGGYVNDLPTGPLPLVKHLDKLSAEHLKAAKLGQVHRAVNALQQTAWTVNADIYVLIREAWSKRLDVGNLPLTIPDEPKKRPSEVPEHARKNLGLKWRQYFGKKDSVVGSATMLKMRLEYCDLLKEYPALYLPHQLDTRGRAYPVPQLFHPQSDDIGRALIKFARAKSLTDRARRWLAIHLATLHGEDGIDKKSFEERAAWVEKHSGDIRRSVEMPFKERFWCEAESPWRFLAACQEWVNPPKVRGRFVSYLPVNVDGTCNGFQHLSALSRDLAAARATNLIPGPSPQDIYQNVLDLLRVQLRKLQQGGDAMAVAWLPRLDSRKVVKRATLATPYGITHGGVKDALIQEELTEGFEDESDAANYLAKHIRAAIEAAAPGSKAILNWLKRVARVLKEHHLPVVWTTPVGFRVVHYYPVREKRTVKAGGFALQVKTDPTDEFEDEQTSAIGANFVHSLDAAHMMLTVNRLFSKDPKRFQDFAAVHDSYGVHACDVDELNRVLRQEFVEIHSRSLLEELVDTQPKKRKIELPPPPEPQSGFDLRAVLKSEYFFS